MGKKKVEVDLYSYGEYSKWERESKAIPKLLNITDTIESDIDTEFGYLLKIKFAKGKVLTFEIEHPDFLDENGKVTPSFTGEVFINKNTFEFFLGDCVWAPAHDKMGDWKLTSWIDGKVVAKKTLTLIPKP